MNNNLKNLNIEPDPEVWDGIRKSLRRKALLKYGAIASSVVVAAASMALLWPSSQPQNLISETHQTIVVQDPSANSVQPLAGSSQYFAQPEPVGMTARTETEKVDFDDSFDNLEPSGTPFEDRYESASKSDKALAAATVQRSEVSESAKNQALASKPAAKTQEPTTTKASKSTNTNEGTAVYVPNAFAPEGDVDANRIFKVFPSEVISNFKLFIYDRAGHKVFEGTSVADGWDGTYKGMKLPQAAYVYVLSYTTSDDKSHTQKGSVVLIR